MDNRFLLLIENSISKNRNLPAFTDYNGTTYNYGDVAYHFEELRILFELAGINKGDKIALIGRNSSEWAMCFFGTLAYGAVIVPILHDFKSDSITHIVNHSEAKVVFVAGSSIDNVDEKEMPNVKLFISLDDFSVIKSLIENIKNGPIDLSECIKKKYPDGFTPENVSYHQEQPDELAVLNYTSGTTSNPKGVMIPFRSLWSNTQYACDVMPFLHPGDPILCILPMAHMYGLAFEILNSFNKGCHVHFLPKVPSPKIIIEAFAKVRPCLILAVPLIIEKVIRNNVFPILEKPLVKLIWNTPLLNKLIKRKILKGLEASFGGNFIEIVIGGAALSKDVETFLCKIKFRYTVGYGMTECGPLISYEQWDTFKPGSVGRVVDRVEIKIDNPNPKTNVGEIYVRGTNLMLGYYKNPEATEAVMKPGGWMNTGDLGLIDKDGFLFIRGRTKTMILGANGQNIYPEEIESKLNNMPYVLESLIISQDSKLTALIYPDWNLINKNKAEALMQENIDKLNKMIPGYCKVTSLKLLQNEFEKTPKRSIKRFLYQDVSAS